MSLLNWYKLDKNANDISGKIIGKVNNVSWVAGKINKAAYFNGLDSFISVFNPLKGKSIFTITFFIKQDLPAVNSSLMAVKVLGNINMMRIDCVDGSTYKMNGAGTIVATGSTLFTHDGTKFDHIIMTSDGVNLYCYKNKQLVSTNPLIGKFPYNVQLVFGKKFSSNFWKGSLDDIKFYDHFFSIKEINEVSKHKVLSYRFDNLTNPSDTNDVRISDSSGYGHDAYLCGPEKITFDDVRTNILIEDNVISKKLKSSNWDSGICSDQVYYDDCFLEWQVDYQDKYNQILGGEQVGFNSTPDFITPNFSIRTSSNGQYSIIENNSIVFSGTFSVKGNDIFRIEIKDSIVKYKINGVAVYQSLSTPTFPLYVTLCLNCFGMENKVKNLSAGYLSVSKHIPTIVEEDVVGAKILSFNGSNILRTKKIFHDDINQTWTINAIVNIANTTIDQYLVNFNRGVKLLHGTTGKALLYINNGANDSYVYSNLLTSNEWLMLTFVLNTYTRRCEIYMNGILTNSSDNYAPGDIPYGMANITELFKSFTGKVATVDIYATDLNASDILDLYKIRFSMDDLGNIYGNLIESNEGGVKRFSVNKNFTFNANDVIEIGPSDNLIAFHRFKTNARDYMGNAHGTSYNVSFIQGYEDMMSAKFLATSYLNIPKIEGLLVNNKFTIVIRFYIDDSTEKLLYNSDGFMNIKIISNRYKVSVFDTSMNLFEANGSSDLLINTWYTLTIIYDGSVVSIILNKNLDSVVTITSGNSINSNNSISLGFVDGIGSFLGSISDIRHYNNILLMEEVILLHEILYEKENKTKVKMKDGKIFLKGSLKGV